MITVSVKNEYKHVLSAAMFIKTCIAERSWRKTYPHQRTEFWSLTEKTCKRPLPHSSNIVINKWSSFLVYFEVQLLLTRTGNRSNSLDLLY